MICSKNISSVLAEFMTIGIATVASANELSSALDTEIVMSDYEITNKPVSISGTIAPCISKTSGTSVKSKIAEQILEKKLEFS